MLRYTILVLSAVFAITTAASAQITFTIGGGNNNGYYRTGQCPPNQGYYGYDTSNPNHYYCEQHREYCNHPQNGYYGNDRRYDRRYDRRNNRRRRNNWRGNRRASRNQCPPPGHSYCNSHRGYCSH